MVSFNDGPFEQGGKTLTGHLFRNSVFLALTICTLVFSGIVLAAQGDIVRTSVNTIGGCR